MNRDSVEIWGGVECTFNRVGDRYFDQMQRSGHAERRGDLGLIRALGVKAMRFPVLWERVAPHGPERADWRWSDARLRLLRRMGVRPIVGLVHHGSGPRGTSLSDLAFPEKLEAFAGAVARRYPWVSDYTPINEPLTTARFSGLYGHWYPHGRDDRTFVRALLNESLATVRAMRAIRQVNPDARLVQTEDMGTVFSTPALADQARFENERRFVSLDLLAGRIDARHPMRRYLEAHGATARELDGLVAEPCPPDMVGINYYITSDRFLDERIERYPASFHGGNGRQAYADVEAVRVRADGIVGHRRYLEEIHERYGCPVAITEAHAGASREDQMRWLAEAHDAALRARENGVDVRAVTVWALFGSYDWNTLVTREGDHYEPGAFDLRAPAPRPTAVARLARELSSAGRSSDPVLQATGWWHREERLLYPPYPPHGPQAPHQLPRARGPAPILITGATGTLGRAFAAACATRGLAYRLTSRHELDIASPESVTRTLDELRPWAVVNAAGYVRVDDAESEADACRRENTVGPATLAVACARRGISMVTFSSDLVFDGEGRETAYLEHDRTSPCGVYGASKAAAEHAVLEALPSALVVRTSAFFGPDDRYNFVTQTLDALARGKRVRAADDVCISPTYVPDLTATTLDLLLDREHGIWHLASGGETTWHELARATAVRLGVPTEALERCTIDDLGLVTKRPRYSVLGSARGSLMPDIEHAIARYCSCTSVAARFARTRAA